MSQPANRRLDSWKEIADYLGRDVRTVIRWEKEKSLPVRRVPGGKRQGVFAYTAEIDAWLQGQPSGVPRPEPLLGGPVESDEVPEHGSSLAESGPWVAATAVLVVALAVWLLWPQFHRPDTRAALPAMKVLPVTSFTGQEVTPAISPDGKYVVFNWDQDGKAKQFDLYIQLIGAGEPLRLTHGGSNGLPAWSPDGRFIAFNRGLPSGLREILIVPALGGRERKVGETVDRDGGSYLGWSPDGRWIAFSDRDTPSEPFSIFFLSPETGERRKFTSPPAGSYGDIFPAFSPDGKTLAFTRGNVICLQPLTGGEARPLTSGERSILHLAWTPDSRDLVFSGLRGGSYELWRMPVAGGSPVQISVGQGNFYYPSIAREGNRLAFMRDADDWNIWRLPLSEAGRMAGPPRKWIASTSEDSSPQYSPDGRKIVFGSGRSGEGQLWICESDGSNPAQLTSFSDAIIDTFSWAPDSQSVIANLRRDGYETYLVRLDGSPPGRITADVPIEVFPTFSRDGRWIYFGSRKNGDAQIWKVAATGGTAVQVTHKGGSVGAESRDGKLLFFSYGAKPGLWRMALPDGEPALLIPSAWGWSLASHGVYFAVAGTAKRPGFLGFYDFKTAAQHELYTPKTDFPPYSGHLGASPEGRHLLYVQIDNHNRDVMLIENFH